MLLIHETQMENTVNKCTLGQRGTSHNTFWTECISACIDLQQALKYSVCVLYVITGVLYSHVITTRILLITELLNEP